MKSASCVRLIGAVRPLAAVLCVLFLGSCGEFTVHEPWVAEWYPAPAGQAVPDHFFLGLKQETDAAALDRVRAHVTSVGGTVLAEYPELRLFFVTVTGPQLDQLGLDEDIEYIEENHHVYATGAQICPPWSLDQIDQSYDTPRDGVYAFSRTGAGVHIWIADTGIMPFAPDDSLLEDFQTPLRTGNLIQDRIGVGYVSSFALRGNAGLTDCVGHGTMLAIAAAGKKYGIAKKAVIHPIAVMDCPPEPSCRPTDNEYGDVNSVIDGLRKTGLAGPPDANGDPGDCRTVPYEPSVLMLAFQTSSTPSFLRLLRRINDCGVVIVTSAGNHPEGTPPGDACALTPAAFRPAITVGAFDSMLRFSGISNSGKCIDILAPGSEIETSLVKDSVCEPRYAGTSIACAHVAGMVALIMEAQMAQKRLTRANAVGLVTKELFRFAVTGKIEGVPSDTLNLALHSPYNTGFSGTVDEDGCQDCVDLAVCSKSSCQDYCGGVGRQPLCAIPPKLVCEHGVTCADDKCLACGRGDEPCCGGTWCAEGFTCNGGRCECGHENQACCNGTECKEMNLACNGQKRCELCGKETEICCTNSKCDLDGNVCDKATDHCEHCGKAGELCCAGNVCGDNLACNAQGKCEVCGQMPNQLCCSMNQCGTNMVCNMLGKCEQCGQVDGQACCANGCGPFLDCINNRCSTCGTGEKIACCQQKQLPCAGGFVCGGKNQCTACGDNDQPCCTNKTCNGQRTCVGGSICKPCGSAGEICCDGAICNAPQRCQNGLCEKCGLLGEMCCGGNVCNAVDAVCNAGACVHCGSDGEPCCRGLGQCTGNDLLCLNSKCAHCGDEQEHCCPNLGNSGCNFNLTCDGADSKCKATSGCYVRCSDCMKFVPLQATSCSDCMRQATDTCGDLNHICRVSFKGNYVHPYDAENGCKVGFDSNKPKCSSCNDKACQ